MAGAQLEGGVDVVEGTAGVAGGEQGGDEDVARLGHLGEEGDETFKWGEGGGGALQIEQGNPEGEGGAGVVGGEGGGLFEGNEGLGQAPCVAQAVGFLLLGTGLGLLALIVYAMISRLGH